MRELAATRGVWIVLLITFFLVPVEAIAQGAAEESDGDAAQHEAELVASICDVASAREVVPVLARLRDSPRARSSVAEALERCIGGDSSATRSTLIISFLEGVRRTDLLRNAVLRTSSPRLHLRIAVSIANVEGDYGALAMAIGRAVEQQLTASDIRLTLRHLLPPRDRPVSDADILGRRALRTWLNHFGILADSPFAQGG